MTADLAGPPRGRFDHAALIVDSDDTVERLLVPVLRRHVASGQDVLVIVNPDTARVLRGRLGQDADAIEWGVADAFYGRLGFAFAGFRQYLETQHAQGRSVHIIAEPDVATDLEAPVDRVAAYLSYEAMCNDVFAGYGCPVTCIWDSRRHPTLVIEGVRSIHDHELTAEGRLENRTCVPAAEYLSGRADVAMPPEPEVSDVDLTLTDVAELTRCRPALWAWAVEFGFADAAADQVTAATNEVITNGLRHGRPPVRVRAWHHDKTLIVQIDDHGGRALPADAGYRPPRGPADGIGLWLARQLADVLLARTDAGRTSVRLYFPYAVTHRELDVHTA